MLLCSLKATAIGNYKEDPEPTAIRARSFVNMFQKFLSAFSGFTQASATYWLSGRAVLIRSQPCMHGYSQPILTGKHPAEAPGHMASRPGEPPGSIGGMERSPS